MTGRLSGELMDAANNRGNAAVKNVKTRTRWLKPTVRSHIIVGK